MKYIKLFRPINLLMVLITQVLFWYFVIRPPFGEKNLIFEFFGASEFFWILLTSFFIMIFGNLINDYFDFENDALNVKGKGVSKKKLLRLSLVFSLLSLFSGILSVTRLHSFSLGMVYFLIFGLLYFYSKIFQRKILIGNLIVSVLTAMLIGVLWLAVYFHLDPILLRPDIIIGKYLYISRIAFFYMVFAFYLSFIREIVKDVEDRAGDMVSGYQSFVIKYGLKKTKILLNILSVGFVLLLLLAIQYFIKQQALLLASVLVLLFVGFAYFHVKLNSAQEKEDFHKLSLWLKGIMIFGILTISLIS